MAGSFCTGLEPDDGFLIKETKAFSEGIYWRASGTIITAPITSNPHEAASDAGVAWQAGWNVANAAFSGTISQADAPCVAVPDTAIA